MTDREVEVRLDMYMAMWLEISAPLRAIFVSYGEADIHFDCYFDGEVSDDDLESMSCIETELIARDDERRNSFTVHQIDYPDPIPQQGICVFARREKDTGLMGFKNFQTTRFLPVKRRDEGVKIAVHEALIGNIGPRLRRLYILYGDTSIHLDCYFDGQVSDEDRDSMASAEMKLSAMFPDNHRSSHTIHRRDYPEPHPKIRICVFARREPEGVLKGDISATMRALHRYQPREGKNLRYETVRLAVQEALIGKIGPRLRKLDVLYGDSSIHLDCYFDGEVSDKDRESMARLEAELRGWSAGTRRISHEIHRRDYPEMLPTNWMGAFARREYFAEPHFTSWGKQSSQQP